MRLADCWQSIGSLPMSPRTAAQPIIRWKSTSTANHTNVGRYKLVDVTQDVHDLMKRRGANMEPSATGQRPAPVCTARNQSIWRPYQSSPSSNSSEWDAVRRTGLNNGFGLVTTATLRRISGLTWFTQPLLQEQRSSASCRPTMAPQTQISEVLSWVSAPQVGHQQYPLAGRRIN